MTKLISIKLLLGLIYLCLILLFLSIFFIFNLGQYFNYKYLSENKDLIFQLRDQHIVFLSFVFFIFAIVWILLQGFGSPLSFLAGFIFGTYLGSFLVITASTIGCTIVYAISKSFFREVIYNNYYKNYSKFLSNLNNNSFFYLFILRLIPAVPVQILNLLPVIFNMKIKDFFFATLLGITIPKIIYVNLASSLANSIKNKPLDTGVIFSKEIIIALSILIIFVLIANFYKNKLRKE